MNETVLRAVRAFVVLLLGALVSGPPAQAWSLFVHELICEMALEQLSDDDRREVFTLSSGQNAARGFTTFAASCEWADDVRNSTHRETYEYHFLNVPRNAPAIDFARDCAAHDCVSQAIVCYAVYLGDDDLDGEERGEALRFLGHFVGDLHQPLHAGFSEDLGGNFLFVALSQGGTPNRKLHAVWDGTIANSLGLRAGGEGSDRVREMRRIAERLVGEITDQQKAAWRHPSVKRWARESYQQALGCAYRSNCEAGQPLLENGNFLSQTYWDRSKPVVEERIKQAAVRLAFLLELAFDGAIDPGAMEAE